DVVPYSPQGWFPRFVFLGNICRHAGALDASPGIGFHSAAAQPALEEHGHKRELPDPLAHYHAEAALGLRSPDTSALPGTHRKFRPCTQLLGRSHRDKWQEKRNTHYRSRVSRDDRLRPRS